MHHSQSPSYALYADILTLCLPNSAISVTSNILIIYTVIYTLIPISIESGFLCKYCNYFIV